MEVRSRDRVWHDDVWSQMDKAVREEVGRVRAKRVPVYCSEQMCYPVAINRAAPFGAGPLVPKVAQV